MKDIQVAPVLTARDRKTFLTFPWRIYRGDKLWVPPLLPEREKVIDPKQGPFFKRGGEADFFIAWQAGKPVGTICAAEDIAVNQQRNHRDCVIGFFECVDDENVARELFLKAKSWAQLRGLDSLYGPFNLDYEDGYGVLVGGRDRPPAILCGHSPPYYQGFFENYGFRPARGENLAFCVEIDPHNPQIIRLGRLAERVRSKHKITIRSGDLVHWEKEAEKVYYLINRALAHLPDFTPWQPETIVDLFRSFLTIADPELILFAEIDSQTVGWFPGIPNLNEAFIKINGLRYPWNYLQSWFAMRKRTECLAIKSVLVLPEYWDTGVSVLLFDEMVRRALAKGYRWADLSITSDDNPDTPILAKHVGAQVYKRYQVYRYPIL